MKLRKILVVLSLVLLSACSAKQQDPIVVENAVLKTKVEHLEQENKKIKKKLTKETNSFVKQMKLEKHHKARQQKLFEALEEKLKIIEAEQAELELLEAEPEDVKFESVNEEEVGGFTVDKETEELKPEKTAVNVVGDVEIKEADELKEAKQEKDDKKLYVIIALMVGILLSLLIVARYR